MSALDQIRIDICYCSRPNVDAISAFTSQRPRLGNARKANPDGTVAHVDTSSSTCVTWAHSTQAPLQCRYTLQLVIEAHKVFHMQLSTTYRVQKLTQRWHCTTAPTHIGWQDCGISTHPVSERSIMCHEN